MQDRTRIAVIYGSTPEGRLCDTVANWVVRQALARPDFEVDVIDPAGRASHAVDSVQRWTRLERESAGPGRLGAGSAGANRVHEAAFLAT